MQYAQLNPDNSFNRQITPGVNIVWDDDNFCTVEALVRDGKAEEFRIVELDQADPPPYNLMAQTVERDGAELVEGRWRYKWRVVDYPAEVAAANLAGLKASLSAEIDGAVAAITTRYAPFLEEYKTREAQAREFAAASYTGPVPQQVAAFATPAGLTAQVAADTIIGQADNLRTASELLGVQRMRKYEVLRAATEAEARAAHASAIATIAAIGSQIG